MTRLSTLAVFSYIPVQFGAARYLMRMLKARDTASGKALQYVVALAVGVAFSFIAAGVLEALGFNVLARVRGLG